MSATILNPFSQASAVSFEFTKQEVNALTGFHGGMIQRDLLKDYSLQISSSAPSFYHGTYTVGDTVFSSVTLIKIIADHKNQYVVEMMQAEVYRSCQFEDALQHIRNSYDQVVLPAPKKQAPHLTIV